MKSKLIIALIFGAIVMSGCNRIGRSMSETKVQNVVPNLVEIGRECNGKYSYLVDKNTGVVYLEFCGYNRFGITVMLNADGSVITAEQLGIEY